VTLEELLGKECECEEPTCRQPIRLGSTDPRKANTAVARPCPPPRRSKDNIESGGNEIRDRSPLCDPEAAARGLIEIANSVEAVQDGRIFIELLNAPMLFEHKATPVEYSAGLNLAIDRGWLAMHESGTYVKFTQAGRSCLHDNQAYALRWHGWVCDLKSNARCLSRGSKSRRPAAGVSQGRASAIAALPRGGAV
jgi:hypothetical protein